MVLKWDWFLRLSKRKRNSHFRKNKLICTLIIIKNFWIEWLLTLYFSNNYCKEKTKIAETDPGGHFSVVEDVEFCAGIPDRNHNGLTDKNKNTCIGESGAPLVCVIDNMPFLTGIESWGYECGAEGEKSKSLNLIFIIDIYLKFLKM